MIADTDTRLARLSVLIDRAELECSIKHLEHAAKFVSKAKQVRDAIELGWMNQHGGEELKTTVRPPA